MSAFTLLTLASLVGQGGRVVSYEPNKFNRQRFQGHLERNPELAKRIRLEPLAMVDRAGELTFRVAEFIESGESSGSDLTAAQQPGKCTITTGSRWRRCRPFRRMSLCSNANSPCRT